MGISGSITYNRQSNTAKANYAGYELQQRGIMKIGLPVCILSG